MPEVGSPLGNIICKHSASNSLSNEILVSALFQNVLKVNYEFVYTYVPLSEPVNEYVYVVYL